MRCWWLLPCGGADEAADGGADAGGDSHLGMADNGGGCGGGSSGQHSERFFGNRNCAKHFIYVVLLTSQLSDEGGTTWSLILRMPFRHFFTFFSFL